MNNGANMHDVLLTVYSISKFTLLFQWFELCFTLCIEGFGLFVSEPVLLEGVFFRLC